MAVKSYVKAWGDTFMSFKILKKLMLVQKLTVPHVKVPIFNFLELEGQGKWHYHRGPCPLPVKRPINMKEIKVSSTVPNRVKPMYCKMFATVLN